MINNLQRVCVHRVKIASKIRLTIRVKKRARIEQSNSPSRPTSLNFAATERVRGRKLAVV